MRSASVLTLALAHHAFSAFRLLSGFNGRAFCQFTRTRPSGQRSIADHIETPRGYKLWVEERNGAILLLDDRCEHVIGFSVEDDRRIGFRLDVDLVELGLSAVDKRGQLMGG